MSIPPSTSSITWLEATRDRMQELQEQLQQMLPQALYAFIKEHPEIERIYWELSKIEADSFSLLGFGVAFWPTEEANAQAREEQLTQEVGAWLRAIPSSVMIELFRQSHKVTFFADRFDSECHCD